MCKRLTWVLIAAMLVVCLVPCYAKTDTDLNDKLGTQKVGSDGSATIAVTADIDALTFSVTVPTTLTVNIDGFGKVTVPTNCKVINNSKCAVVVSNVEVTSGEGWTKSPWSDNFNTKQLNTKEFALKINDAESDIQNTFYYIDGKTSEPFQIAFKMPAQNQEISEADIAKIIFTVGWRTDDNLGIDPPTTD